MDILNNFGIDWRLLIAQIINFAILLFILKKVLYKPILEMLETRKQKIADSVKQAEEIELKLQKTEQESEKRLDKASVEARKILEESTKTASEMIEEAKQKAQVLIDEMLQKNNQAMQQERQKLQQEFKEESAEIIVKALTKVTGKIIDNKDQKKIIEKTIKEL